MSLIFYKLCPLEFVHLSGSNEHAVRCLRQCWARGILNGVENAWIPIRNNFNEKADDVVAQCE
jgi:hypothetical protein